MVIPHWALGALALGVVVASAAAASPGAGKRESPATQPKNVLLLLIDDLRPNIGAYGHDFMHTPNMDKLASGGTMFQRAYVQYSFCGPSRNSFLTGRRPDATQAWSFMDHFREQGVGDKWTSLPQYFRDRGYSVLGTGKIFHPGLPPSFDAPKSWDRFVYPGSCDGTTNGWPVLDKNVTNVQCPSALMGCPSNKTGAIVKQDPNAGKGGARWCSLDTTKLPDGQNLTDEVIASTAEGMLHEVAAGAKRARAAGEAGKPWFIAAGFHRPHLPFAFPQQFHDLYPWDSIKAPQHREPPQGMPLCAWHEGNFANKWDAPTDSPSPVNGYRRAYYAAVSYTDSLVGRVLATLDNLGLANDTVVALMGDHGWELGELNLWRKMVNFEIGVRVPLIVRAPWKQASVGVKSSALAEAVDLYPTLVALAGLQQPGANETLQGTDLSPLFDTPAAPGSTGLKPYAFSQFAKRDLYSKELKARVAWDECTKCHRADIDVHGYSVRVQDWRYTEWVAWNKTTLRPIWDSVVGRELYNHSGDMGTDFDASSPTHNVWNASAAHGAIVANLSAVVHAFFDSDHVPPDASVPSATAATAAATGGSAGPEGAAPGQLTETATSAPQGGVKAAIAANTAKEREYGIFLGLNYYGPPVNHSIYERVAAAAQHVPVYVSTCADHNDTSGGAEHRRPHGDPLDGGRITPICDLDDAQGAAVRAGLEVMRSAGVHVLHYTHTRLTYYPNGTEERCCECCEDLPYVLSRVDNATRNFPMDGVFVDNVVANGGWYEYYAAIAGEAVKSDPSRPRAMNENCAHDGSEPCSPYCEHWGHTAAMCADCSSPRCSNMPAKWFDLADVHLLSEGTAGGRNPPDFKANFSFPLTDAMRSKISMFTYNATADTWRGLIDAARAQGFSKFFVDDVLTTSFLDLPPWFEEMVAYIAALNVDDALPPHLAEAAEGASATPGRADQARR